MHTTHHMHTHLGPQLGSECCCHTPQPPEHRSHQSPYGMRVCLWLGYCPSCCCPVLLLVTVVEGDTAGLLGYWGVVLMRLPLVLMGEFTGGGLPHTHVDGLYSLFGLAAG